MRKSKKQKKYQYGGPMSGPSHTDGGIPIEVEGGEYIIKKDSVNSKTEGVLNYINKNGKLPKGLEYNYPSLDSKKRRKNAKS